MKTSAIWMLGTIILLTLNCTETPTYDGGACENVCADGGYESVDASIDVDTRCEEECEGRPDCVAIDGFRWTPDGGCFAAAFAGCGVPVPQPDATPNWEAPDGECWAGLSGTWEPPRNGWQPVEDDAECAGRSNLCE